MVGGRRPASSVRTAGCVRLSAPTLLTSPEVAGFNLDGLIGRDKQRMPGCVLGAARTLG